MPPSRAVGFGKLMVVRLTVKAINNALAKRGSGAQLEKGDGNAERRVIGSIEL
jgi:hypothetical protein